MNCLNQEPVPGSCSLFAASCGAALRAPRLRSILKAAGVLTAILLGVEIRAQTTNQPPTDPSQLSGERKGIVSAASSTNRAPWQIRFTLGPGDELSIALFGQRPYEGPIPIGLDGRITYLQARDIVAAGLTIDELRAKLDQELSKDDVAARTMITPVNLKSKKYFLLGKVQGRGVYVLERPKTVLEAVAQAGGLELGFIEGNAAELADLGRSFLVRNGKRVAVDFELLFQQGDLSQNVPIEPDDYLYFASADANEVYLLGEILSPGIGVLPPNASLLAVLATRGDSVRRRTNRGCWWSGDR